jgi:hypothetical protein
MSDMGDDIHDLVHAFADGELEPAEAESFRAHLGTCERCQAELDDILQLQALSGRLAAAQAKQASAPAPAEAARPAEPAQPTEATRPAETARSAEPPSSRVFRPTWARRRTALAVVLGGSLAAAFALVVLRGPGGDPGGVGPGALALAPSRSLEARLSYGGASGWRPYSPMRSGGGPAADMVPLETLAKLEEAGDLHGLATSYLLRGEREQAADSLGKLSSSPNVESDRAAMALSQGALAEALGYAEAALAQAPNHAPALWNRGLVLRELGLELRAAESFGKVAALNEPGWSEEARERQATLERQGLERQRRWQAVADAGKAMVEQGTPLSESQVRQAPSLARRFLYQAVWSAPSAERVRALLPVARAVDAHYGVPVLEHYVERMARRDFSQRGPLAATFARVLSGSLDASAAEDFLRQLQAAGEPDLLVGALPLLRQLPARLNVYEAAAREVGDPWFVMDVELRRARAQSAAGEPEKAEATLRAWLPLCEQQGLDYRCAEMAQALAELSTARRKPPAAREYALRGLKWATQASDEALEAKLLQSLIEARAGQAPSP